MFISIQRNGTEITNQTVESHGNSWNNPFSLSYIDVVASGTYKYTFMYKKGNGEFELGEYGDKSASQCMAFEI